MKRARNSLVRAIRKEVERDSSFLEKCNYHEKMMVKFNTTGKSPMELAETEAGQKLLDKINANVSRAMVERFGKV